MVSVENLNVIFGKKHIVHDVSFNVKKGEIIGMFGISGAGKTTIIRVLTCQIEKKHWNGNALVTGLDPSKKSNQLIAFNILFGHKKCTKLNKFAGGQALILRGDAILFRAAG